MAFNLDRTEAAKRLGVSTRTIDRYIQSEKIRTRRVGKKMFLEEIDIEKLRNEDAARRDENYEVVTNTASSYEEKILSPASNQSSVLELSPDTKLAIAEFSRIYSDAQGIIAEKNEVIKDLSYKLGTAETELKNSINISEYNKATFLLETEKLQHEQASKNFGEKISHLEKEVHKKNSFIIGMVILFVLVVIASFVFFFYNRLF